MDERDALETVVCPTCRARQEWADTCRRCRSDLSLLRAYADSYHRARFRCLAALRRGDPRAAVRAARRCAWLRPGTEANRLLASAALLAGDWSTALAAANSPQNNWESAQ